MRTRSIAAASLFLAPAVVVMACGDRSDVIGAPVVTPAEGGSLPDVNAEEDAGPTLDARARADAATADDAEANAADNGWVYAAGCYVPSPAALAGTGCVVALPPRSACAVAEYELTCGAAGMRLPPVDPRCLVEPGLSSGGAFCCPCAAPDGGVVTDAAPVEDTECAGKARGTPCCPGGSDLSQCPNNPGFVCDGHGTCMLIVGLDGGLLRGPS